MDQNHESPGTESAENIAGSYEPTEFQDAIRLKLLATYQANLIFFEKEFPHVYAELLKHEPVIPFSIGEDGNIGVKDKFREGSAAYFRELGKQQFSFFDDPKARVRVVTRFGYLQDEKCAAPHGDNPGFFCPIEPEHRFALIRKFKELCPTPEDRNASPDFGDKAIPIVIAFGVGFGHDIQLIVENYTLQHLILVEHDIGDLDLSLYFLDYASLFHQFKYRGGKYLTILTAADTSELTHDVLMAIRGHWPPYFVRGAALHYNDYRSEEIKEISTKLSNGISQLFSGWGFFDDETLSLLNSAQNIERHIPLCVREEKATYDNSIAFLVGSGPSLDHLWPLVEKYRDRVVLICCGSAISVFMKKGIKPDFYIEIERGDFTYDFMAEPRLQEFVKDIPLLFLPVIPPGCFSFSEKPMMILKQVDGGTQAIDIENRYPRFSTGPTVTNAGTDFALRMGFSEVYLLGVDVGYPKDGPHHSKLSYYYDEKHATDIVASIVKDTDAAMKLTTGVPGNFDDEVDSTSIFISTRDTIAYSIRVYGDDKKVFNLNNGAAIKGAEPLHPEDIDITSRATDRQQSLARIAACFSTDYPIDMTRNLAFLAEQMEAVHADVSDIFARPISCKMDVCDILSDLNFYLFAKKHQVSAAFPMLRGSLYHLCNIFYDCLGVIRDEQTAIAYAHASFDQLLEFILHGREIILSIPKEAKQRLANLKAAEQSKSR